jgi:hypothetical protein
MPIEDRIELDFAKILKAIEADVPCPPPQQISNTEKLVKERELKKL